MPVYITPQKVKMRQLSGNNSDQFYGLDVVAAETTAEHVAAINDAANTATNNINNTISTATNNINNTISTATMTINNTVNIATTNIDTAITNANAKENELNSKVTTIQNALTSIVGSLEDPQVEFPIDSELITAGAAADAKVVGDQLGDLKSALYNGEAAVFGSCKQQVYIRASDFVISEHDTAIIYVFKVERGNEYTVYFFGGNIRRVAYANSDFSLGLQLTQIYNKSGAVLLEDSTYTVNVQDYDYLYVQVTSNPSNYPGTVSLRKKIAGFESSESAKIHNLSVLNVNGETYYIDPSVQFHRGARNSTSELPDRMDEIYSDMIIGNNFCVYNTDPENYYIHIIVFDLSDQYKGYVIRQTADSDNTKLYGNLNFASYGTDNSQYKYIVRVRNINGSTFPINENPVYILKHQPSGTYDECKIINGKLMMKESLIFNNGSFTSSGITRSNAKYVYSDEIVPDAYVYNPEQYEIKIYTISAIDHSLIDSASFPYLTDQWIYLPGGNAYRYRLTVRKSSNDISVPVNIQLYRDRTVNLSIYDNEINDTVEKVQKASLSKSIVFGVLTDTHIDMDRNKSYRNSEITLETMKQVNARCHFDGILHLGDIIDGSHTIEESIAEGSAYTGKLLSICQNVYYSLGNHESNFVIDSNHYEQISLAQNYAIFGRQNEKHVVRTDNNMYYYKDIGFMRLIVLNGYTAGITNNNVCRETYDGERYGYSTAQIEWVRDQALNTTLPVLLICHFPITYEYLSESYREDFKGSKALFNGDALRAVLQNFLDDGGTILGLLHGHNHGTHIAKYQSNGFFEISSDAAVFVAYGNNSTSDTPQGYIRYARQWNTQSQESWNVCVVDDTKTLSLIRFGAGIDIAIHAEKVNLASTVSLTSKLSGELTWSTSDSSVATVSDGVVTKVSAGTCDIKATDEDGNIEIWTVKST